MYKSVCQKGTKLQNRDKRCTTILIIFLASLLCLPAAYSQEDTLSPSQKGKFKRFLNNFDVSVYMDVYATFVLNSPSGDTSNMKEFAANSPFKDEFRLNVASLWLGYNSKNIRGKLLLQFGDVPDLQTSPEEQFIKHMKEAHFGFRVYKTLWVDLGYLLNFIGYESSLPIKNQISSVTTGGYFSVGNYLGLRLTAQITPSFFAGAYIGNPYTLAFGKNKRLFGRLRDQPQILIQGLF